ncbi:MAG: MlaD family protein [Endomicrobium sp.]|jgi:phospholipid/cholesterol/gamma-HCH transport system substrate-binding protein|nr:MlaD family protein [Endomicrobium sp.]
MSKQLKLGIFVFLGIIAAAVSIIAAGAFSLKRTYNIYAKFDNISGLTEKAKVKIAGVGIGVLRGVSLDDSRAKLRLSIHKNVKLYRNGVARIVSMGVIGTKYIEISPGDSSAEELKGDDYIFTEQSSSLEIMLRNISTRADKAMHNERYGDMMENLANAICSLKDVMKNFASENENISEIINNLNKFSRDVAAISSENGRDLRSVVLSIKDVSEKLDALIDRIANGNGMISTLINDEQIGKDLKETVASAKETVKGLKDTIGKTNKLQLSWNYTGRYDMKDGKLRSDVGISIMPSRDKFYYVGISNVADHSTASDSEKNRINKLDALLGFRAEKSEIYGGVIRGKAGVGFGYSFFEPVWAEFRRLKVHLNMRDFGREKHGPVIDAGMRVGIAQWLYAGVALEDISYKTAVTPYIKLEIDDKDLAALLRIISLAAVTAK